MQISLGHYVLRVRWWVVCVMIVAVYGCVRLGLWQWHKAEQKQAITHALAHKGDVFQPAVSDLSQASRLEAMHLQTLEVTGHYLPQFSFLLDNQIANGRAGFHVITPFLLDDQHHVLWVNRGWVAGFDDHQQVPVVDTPVHLQTIRGLLWLQKKTGFRLDKAGDVWQPVQQVIDFHYLHQQVPYPFPDAILKLDATSRDGFLRQWDVPAGQVEKHMSYAYQWFGFALASLVIGLIQMLEKRAGV